MTETNKIGLNDIEALLKIGFKRPVAKTLACLADGTEKNSFEIELAAELRQPEVSVALRELMQKGFVDFREVKKSSGKGRPTKLFKLVVPASEVISLKAAETEAEMKSVMETVQALIVCEQE